MRTPLLLLLLASTAPAQEARVFRLPFGESVSRAADGAAVCGLGRDWHAGRRAELARRLETGIVVLRGLPDPRASVAFRQDKNFWYLTGIESPDVALLLDLDRGEEVLFVAKPSAFKESWAGEIWDADDAWVRDLTGIEDVRANDAGRGGNRALLEALDAMVDVLSSLGQPAVFPVHPRTRAKLQPGGRWDALARVPGLVLAPPAGYLDFTNLLMNARAVVTDSGGVQKEAYFHGIPCITLRDTTEWVETVEGGFNALTGMDAARVGATLADLSMPAERPPYYGDGHAAEAIARAVLKESGETNMSGRGPTTASQRARGIS